MTRLGKECKTRQDEEMKSDGKGENWGFDGYRWKPARTVANDQ